MLMAKPALTGPFYLASDTVPHRAIRIITSLRRRCVSLS